MRIVAVRFGYMGLYVYVYRKPSVWGAYMETQRGKQLVLATAAQTGQRGAVVSKCASMIV